MAAVSCLCRIKALYRTPAAVFSSSGVRTLHGCSQVSYSQVFDSQGFRSQGFRSQAVITSKHKYARSDDVLSRILSAKSASGYDALVTMLGVLLITVGWLFQTGLKQGS